MRFDLTATFENMEDESTMMELGIPLTSKKLAIRVLNNAASNGMALAQGGCTDEKRRERGKLARRFKKMIGHISLSPEELVELKKCSHESNLMPHLHDQFCEMVDGCGADEKDAPKE